MELTNPMSQDPSFKVTEHDERLIRSLTIDEYVKTGKSVHQCYIEVILGFIHSKGFDIVKSEIREPTVRDPSARWYLKDPKKG